MKSFQEFIKEGKVIKQSPDKAESSSLFKQAEERLADLITLPISERNASFRFEDAYEVLREATQAFLSAEGYKSYSHEALFSFAKERKLLTESDVIRSNQYRETRNDINYRAKKVTKEEAEEIIAFTKKIMKALKEKHQNPNL